VVGGLWGFEELAVLRLTGVVFKRLPGIAVPEVLPGERGTDPRPQGELNWSSQQPEGGSCDDQWEAAFGTIWAAAIVVTRSTARGRTRRAATVLGRHRVRHGE
jgi:hypothetical protein